MRSVIRKQRDRLYLIVKKSRAEHAWQFPQGGREGKESLVQVSEHLLSCICLPFLHFCVACPYCVDR